MYTKVYLYIITYIYIRIHIYIYIRIHIRIHKENKIHCKTFLETHTPLHLSYCPWEDKYSSPPEDKVAQASGLFHDPGQLFTRLHNGKEDPVLLFQGFTVWSSMSQNSRHALSEATSCRPCFGMFGQLLTLNLRSHLQSSAQKGNWLWSCWYWRNSPELSGGFWQCNKQHKSIKARVLG